MNHGAVPIIALAALAAVGCSTPGGEKPTLDPALAEHVLGDVPSDLENQTLIDFGGKVHLVGWAVQPTGSVKRGDKVQLKLYWRSVAPLTRGWRLFTHVLDDQGRQIANVDNVGPLRQLVTDEDGERQTLAPSAWRVGKVYVDTQEFTIPATYPNSDGRELESETVAIAVGIWKYAPRRGGDGGPRPPADMRLAVLGGTADSTNRAIVVRFTTDYRYPRQAVAEPVDPAPAQPVTAP